jgi:FkbM family methyltransferase
MVYAVLIICLLGMATACYVVVRRKNRLIWRQLWQLRDELSAHRREFIDLRKGMVLAQVGDSLRLKAAMPSQYGEDLLIWNFFRRKRDGFYVEVGAYDGTALSNTYFFEALGWEGVLVEPVPEYYQSCLSSRPYSRVVNAAAGRGDGPRRTSFSIAEGVGTLSFMKDSPRHVDRILREGGSLRSIEVPLYSLNEILADYQGAVDFISIDVEGAEMDVLMGLDLNRFRPRMLVIEDNSNGSDARVKEWLGGFGYVERYRCEQNVFYTKSGDEGRFQWVV